MSTPDNDRISYLSGEPVDALSPRERAELDGLRALLETPAMWEEPAAGLEDRVLAAVAQEVRRGGATEPAVKEPRPRLWSRWRPRRPALAFGGLAAATAAIVVAVVVALSGNSARPLRFAMVVSGTSLAPAAHGSATLTKTESGWRIDLSATGLPHLANGRYYQAWLENPAGVFVPVGTFNDAERVTLWSGAPVTQFRAFSVTEQLANGNPVSSGRRVLAGIAQPAH